MKNFKIRTKIVIGFGTLLVLIIILNAVSIVNLRKVSNLVTDLYDGPFNNTVSAVSLHKDLNEMESAVKSMVLTGEEGDYSSKYQTAKSNTTKELEEIVLSNAEMSPEVSSIKLLLDKVDTEYNNVVSFVKSEKGIRAKEAVNGSFSDAVNQAKTAAQQLQQKAINLADTSKTSSTQIANSGIIFQDILFVIIVVAALVLSLRISLSITRPLRRLAEGMDEISKGKLDVEMKNDSRDEIGILTRQLNEVILNIRSYIGDITMILGEISKGNITVSVEQEYIGDYAAIKTSLNQIVASLNDTMQEIQNCCEQVRAGASNLAQSSEMLAHGSAEQTTSVTLLGEALNKVATLTSQDGENAAHVKGISLKATEAVGTCDLQMKEMLSAMGDINNSSQEIAKVVKLIEDIAFQTNILALNAAVEAARAGAAGKGFAVVADEVRNLASKSADAAKSTTSMITAAISSVNRGIESTNATAGSLGRVRENVAEMAVSLENIDKSTQEQAIAFAQMQDSVQQISHVVETNSAAAEENSGASEELSAQAQALDKLVEKFHVKKAQTEYDIEMF